LQIQIAQLLLRSYPVW